MIENGREKRALPRDSREIAPVDIESAGGAARTIFVVQVNTIPAIFLTKNRFKREGMGVRRNERDSRAPVPLGAASLKNTWRKRPRFRHTRDTQSTDQAKHKIVLTIPNVIFLR